MKSNRVKKPCSCWSLVRASFKTNLKTLIIELWPSRFVAFSNSHSILFYSISISSLDIVHFIVERYSKGNREFRAEFGLRQNSGDIHFATNAEGTLWKCSIDHEKSTAISSAFSSSSGIYARLKLWRLFPFVFFFFSPSFRTIHFANHNSTLDAH